MQTTITEVTARQIFDSRGNPTVEVDLILENGALGRSASPSGASTGSNEVVELRDGGKPYGGKGVTKAVSSVIDVIAPAIKGRDAADQAGLDALLCELDGTENKSRLGGNAILAVSLAAAKATARAQHVPLHVHIAALAGNHQVSLPLPMINILNGGKHAAGSTDIQEFMIMPIGANTMAEALRMSSEVFHSLGKVISARGYATTVGDEGGYAPAVKNGNAEALELIAEAIEKSNYQLGTDFLFALDVAASELYKNGKYHLATEKRTMSDVDIISWYEALAKKYPIISIEDGLAEDDWDGWRTMTEKMGNKHQIVGDDLLVTNTKFLRKAIDQNAGNAILVKPNQIGTLSETIEAVNMAQSNGWGTIMSHRSGETEDPVIAHLAVGLNTGQIKTGSMSRSDRLAKYNELLRLEESLPEGAYVGNIFAGI